MNQAGYDLLKNSEGLKLEAYLCPAGKWTIGYGSTLYEDGSKVKEGDSITKERAENLMINLLSKYEKDVKKLIKVQLDDNQFSALVDFTYNVGTGNFRNSTLLRKINSGEMVGASKEFERWVYSNKVKLPGLIKRRKEEKALFLK
ncbi:lysozyme [uncultured Ilyobacter sp.]|uniref:lysozyme n=1 Tax=uncultured Ilyobacter sp. TaxID=544433 RepID=UPI0029BFBDCD|nr:lysozyme [uncultured Ilyobacter sp.]